MALRPVLKMGDPRLLERSKEVERFGTRELEELLVDMHDTMAALSGAGPYSMLCKTLATLMV